jgi:hypothetical protein
MKQRGNALSHGLRPFTSTPANERAADSDCAIADDPTEPGVLDIVVADGEELAGLSVLSRPYLSCALNGQITSSRPPSRWREADPACPVWDHAIKHDVSALDPGEKRLLVSVYDAADADALLGVARLTLPDPLPTTVCEHRLRSVTGLHRRRSHRPAIGSLARMGRNCQGVSVSRPSLSPCRTGASRTTTLTC